MKKLVCCVVLFAFTVGAQNVSIHQWEYEQHRNIPEEPSAFDTSGKDINPIALGKRNQLSTIIFGYLPDWMYQSARYNLQYELLTHIAAFDFTVSASGAVAHPSYWPWTDVINAAHAQGVKVVMTAVNFNKDNIRTIMTDEKVKETFYKNCRDIIHTYKLDGINVDFESLYSADRGSLLNGFMKDLTDYIHEEIPGSEVSFAGPAVNWGGWDLYGLAQSCDYIFIMGYAFYGSWSSTSGPCAPLTGGSINITNTVLQQYQTVTRHYPERLILGVPYYGNRWQTRTSAARSESIDYIGSVRHSTGISEAAGHGLIWESLSQTPWYHYQSGNDWYQVWFDTDESLGLKYDLAEENDLLGVGMWALGYDGSRDELWNELAGRYVVSSVSGNQPLNPDEQIPNHIILSQNYPNPFNPVTTIRYQISGGKEGETPVGAYGNTPQRVELTIHNMAGQIITTLVSENQLPGEYTVQWNASNIPSGIFFYKLTTKDQSRKTAINRMTRKMILLK